jgi:hypothetical protein
LRAKEVKEDFYNRPFAGVGIARFGQNGPNNRNPNATMRPVFLSLVSAVKSLIPSSTERFESSANA